MFSKIKKWFLGKEFKFDQAFEDALGDNLYSLIQYGSSVKNESDNAGNINILVVLNRSTPEAHNAIHQIILAEPQIEPFILGKRGFERTVLSFAVKFLSISRHYKLLSGQDVLADLNISLKHERFLAEQALRNLRLKIIHCYAKRGASKTYVRFVTSIMTSIIVDISEVLRCEQKNVPIKYSDRIASFTQQFDFEVTILNQLIALKKKPRSLTQYEVQALHRNLFIVLDNILLYIENHWNE